MFVEYLKRFFLVNNQSLQSINSAFEKSALRIFLSFTTLIFAGLSVQSWLYCDLSESLCYAVSSTLAFGVLLVLLYLSRSKTQIAAGGYCLLLFATGLSFLLEENEVVAFKFGIVSLYSLPLIIRLFFSFRLALVASLLNIGTLIYSIDLLNDNLVTLPFEVAILLNILVFGILNVTLPLAVSRVLHALEVNAKHMQKMYSRLNRNNLLYEEIFEHTGTPTLLCDKRGRILRLNKQASDLLNSNSKKRLEGTSIDKWLKPISDSVNRFFWQSNASECLLKSNSKMSVEVHRSQLTNHGHYVLHLQNTTHLKALTQELESTQQTNSRLSQLDLLTSLPNHFYFSKLVDERLKAQNSHFTGAVAIIKISQFKLLNKQYGKDKSNRIILNFSKSLKSRLSDQTILARLRGVKFACFLPLGQTYLIQRNLSTLINSALPGQLRIDGHQLNMDYQVGVVYLNNDGATAEELLEHCEMALEYSTSADRIAYYDKELEHNLMEEHQIGLKLVQAIQNKEIDLWLQPQVHSDGQIRSFEALARWRTDDGSFVSPVVFIRIAEDLGLLPKLAENLLREIVSILAQWHDEHIRTPVAFNLAGQELMNDAFFALLMSLTAEHPWLGDMLELEITETSPVMTNPLIHKRLRALSSYGYSIAIDDFGTGQASLGQLVDIPANILKIDRRFVSPLPDDIRHIDIVKSTITLAKSLNMKVIAEGIETKEQATLLTALGCDTLQGYYFGKPSPIEEWTDNSHEKAKELRMVY
ncbi:putative bifunctional diguanylate cyclase/phosphodiesterase [Marinomonas balearica]|uniref:Diguanylate cyclase/phosphodiesterase n=1 Tax=Marinomonas balearica TaxID=491947 RepID=A0A4R6MDF7_9GAMM|nr:bifunctional diguanylate cyclase/phosphodiesterase [Marinomonas balearica]TDO99737.1 diguanylate cyclase/phosphodiesterase [Marinomonas balearica]